MMATGRLHEEFAQTVAGFGLDAMMGVLDVAYFKQYVLEWIERHDRVLANNYAGLGFGSKP